MTKQDSLFDLHQQTDNSPVVCLGMKFENEESRREYFHEELRKKLPDLKRIEGFPIGEDEDIITLSDPPYYTACPNPWLNEFINVWKNNSTNENHISPLAIDISEGKSDSAYMAHAYHTKVPAKAIEKYISHFTSKEDIIFDGFSGSGMTGVGVELANKNDEGHRKVILNDFWPSYQLE